MPDITPQARAIARRVDAFTASAPQNLMSREIVKQQLAASRTLLTLLDTSYPVMPPDYDDQVGKALRRLADTTETFAREIHTAFPDAGDAS